MIKVLVNGKTYEAEKDKKLMRFLRDDLHLTSIWENFTQAEIFNTYHGFKGKRKGDPIDYIFFSEEFELEDAYIDQTSFDGRYPSDHYPLVATLRLKK